MAIHSQQERQKAQAYLDRLSDSQVVAVCNLLEAMLDPVSRVLANAPLDDEPADEPAVRPTALDRGIPLDQVLADFGLTPADFVRMAQTDPAPFTSR